MVYTVTDNILITQPAAIVLTETHVNANCNGASTGSIDLSVAANITYNICMEQWSNDPDLTNHTSRNL
jgi:hypothetical protein